MDTNQCRGKTKDGNPCSAAPRAGSQFCPWHDPALAGERQQWKRDAGKVKSNRSRARKRILAAAMDLSEIDAALCAAHLDVLDGRLEPGTGTAAATIARSIDATRSAAELEQRLRALEERAGIRQGWSA